MGDTDPQGFIYFFPPQILLLYCCEDKISIVYFFYK